jgi:hypothetical protein
VIVVNLEDKNLEFNKLRDKEHVEFMEELWVSVLE